MRDLLRKRAHLVRQHTANVLSVQNILARNTGSRFSVKRIHELTKQELQSMLAEEPQVLAVTSSLAVLDCLKHQIKTLEQTVHKRLHHTGGHLSAGRAGIATEKRYAFGFLRQGFQRRPMPNAMPTRHHTRR